MLNDVYVCTHAYVYTLWDWVSAIGQEGGGGGEEGGVKWGTGSQFIHRQWIARGKVFITVYVHAYVLYCV